MGHIGNHSSMLCGFATVFSWTENVLYTTWSTQPMFAIGTGISVINMTGPDFATNFAICYSDY